MSGDPLELSDDEAQVVLEQRAEEQASRTPRLTDHARQRCREMGIRTKVAKAIVRHADVTYPGPEVHGDNWVSLWQGQPEYAVAWRYDPDGRRCICTVLYNHAEFSR